MITLTESAPVVVKFQIGDYSDALQFTDQADRDQHSSEQIEAMCQQRYDNWLAVINTPRPEPTPEDLQAQVDSLVSQVTTAQEQIVALAPPEIAVPILEDQQAKIAEQLATLNEAAGRG